MLKIHSNPEDQRENLPLAPMVHSLFRDVSAANKGTSWEQRFADWWRIAPRHITSVPLAEADVAVLSFDWYWVRGPSWRSKVDHELRRRAVRFAEMARSAGKPLVVFFSGDNSHERVPMRDAIVIREGPYRSRLRPRDLVLPGFTEDLVAHFFEGTLPVRSWAAKPVVGFCGLAARRTSWSDHAKTGVYHARMLATQRWAGVSPLRGENMRTEALDTLRQDPGLDTNFVVQEEGVFFRDADPNDLVAVRRSYVANLAASDYVLCCRGSGNSSYRLYETLCMGRIPIHIDTDCALPVESAIDWRRCCVWVDESDLDRVAEKVQEFHDGLGPEGFAETQRYNREVWLRYIAPSAFFANLHGAIGN